MAIFKKISAKIKKEGLIKEGEKELPDDLNEAIEAVLPSEEKTEKSESESESD